VTILLRSSVGSAWLCLVPVHNVVCGFRHVIILGDINTSHRRIDHCSSDTDPVTAHVLVVSSMLCSGIQTVKPVPGLLVDNMANLYDVGDYY